MNRTAIDRSSPVERLVIGSRRSRLARRQAQLVGEQLRLAWPALDLEYVTMSTAGDEQLDRPLPEIGGKGLFTAELDGAIARGAIDIAVHSAKDLPTEFDPRLAIVAWSAREDPSDVLVVRSAPQTPLSVEELPPGAVVGTSSLRRQAQLLRRQPACEPRPIRGNVETRLGKLERGEFDALVLAYAGLARLGLLDERAQPLDPVEWLPAPGQGALAIQGRADDPDVRATLAAIDDPDARATVTAERALLAELEGGCQVPIGAIGRRAGDRLTLIGGVFSPDGGAEVRASGEGAAAAPGELGRTVARELLAGGAAELLIR